MNACASFAGGCRTAIHLAGRSLEAALNSYRKNRPPLGALEP
jgi:hypothetical protein